MVRMRVLWKHDADDADSIAFVRAGDGISRAAMLLGPATDGPVIRGNFAHVMKSFPLATVVGEQSAYLVLSAL